MFEETDLKPNEINRNYKAVTCEQIPELFLDKIVAKKHFSKFGKIKKFILRPKHLSCTIEYENVEDAEKAFMNAGSYNGIDFFVNYAQQEVAHIQSTEEWVDPEVQAELEAMSTGQNNTALKSSAIQKTNEAGRILKNTNVGFSLKPIKAYTATNRQNSPQPEIAKIDSTVRQELEAVLKMPAFTCEEKYRVLDARDKLIRLTSVRQTDIRKAVAIKGTCPDMCPEKERLMREFQRQVSIFEMAEGSSEPIVSHKKAVKEYSRSSADQEVPLSHELRSEPVLQMTMLYLMHRIMGLCDDPKISLCDWFHFVWDRTRSIRKDITQQELCSLGAVQLVEQCARFHIHCAARLVAEDPSVFDKKINAENLTKCLQTLKYMYHDLRIKGVFCPCEAEFRSYIILLNLGDSNFLWEIKQLPELLQRSFEIKRAIAFYNALQNNNFVRFFAMVKSPDTSYLSACILLGYFTKLRIRAMDAIIKSHNWRKNDVYLPLSYMTRILGFDDESSAVHFFNYYGLHFDALNKRVLLDRLIKPNVEYPMERALKLVESKLKVSVGECVFGQTLPPTSLFECHKPHSSFDSNGMLKMEPMIADNPLMELDAKTKVQTRYGQENPERKQISDNETYLFKVPQNISNISSKDQRKSHLQQRTHENALDNFPLKNKEESSSAGGFRFSNNIFEGNFANNSSNESIFGAPKRDVQSAQIPGNLSHTIFKPIIPTFTRSKDDIVARETVNIFQQMKNDVEDSTENNARAESALLPNITIATPTPTSQLRMERSPTSMDEMKNITSVECDGYSKKDKQMEEDRDTSMEFEFSDVCEKLKQEEEHEREVNKLKIILEKKAEQTAERFILQSVDEEVYKLAQTELNIWQTFMESSDLQKDLLISEVVQALVIGIANEECALMCHDQLLLNRYFGKWLMYLRKKKEQRRLVENTPLWITTNTRAEYAEALKHPCQQTNMEIIKRYRLGKPCDFNTLLNIDCDNTLNKNVNHLNLFALVGRHLLPKRSVTSCGLLQQRKYFKFLITIPDNTEELLGFENFLNKCLMRLIGKSQTETGPFVKGIEHGIVLCVRKVHGIIPKNEQGNYMTTEGDHSDGVICFISGIEIDMHSRKRLFNLLQLTKNLKRVPLAIIAYNCNCDEENLAELLGLDLLQEEGLIYSYLILGCQTKRNDFNWQKLLIKAVDFITSESYSLNSNEVQALAMQNILPFLESSLGEEMWQRWLASAKKNPVFKKIFCIPQHVIGIFHKALDHLMHITQEDFDEMPEFPQEFKEFVPENICYNIPLGLEYFPLNWKDKSDKTIIKSFLQSLYLPDIEEKVPDNIEDLKMWLLKYTSQCIPDDDLAVTEVTHEAIKNLVNEIKLQLENGVEVSSSARQINYLTVFKPIVFVHINKMLQHFKDKLLNLKVVYLKDDLKNYQTQPWWLNYEPLNLVTVDHSEISSSLSPTTPKDVELNVASTDVIDKVIAKAEETSRKAEEMISKFKRRKQLNSSNSLANMSTTSQLKRTLDDSIYQFELSKKVGQFDTSFVTGITSDIEKSISNVLNQSSLLPKKKKIFCKNSLDQHSDIDNVISKAMKIIHNVESMENRKFKK